MAEPHPIVYPGSPSIPGTTYEYRLPAAAADFHRDHRKLLTPWFQRCLGQTPEAVRKILSEDWKGFDFRSAIAIRDHLLTYVPKSLVIHEDRVWLALATERSEMPLLIREPRRLDDRESRFVKSFGVDALETFCRHFYDVQQSIDPYNNSTVMRPSPIEEEAFPKAGAWRGGIDLYYICSGDALVMAPDRRIGRWNHTGGVKATAWSFDEFVGEYLSYTMLPREKQKGTIFW